MNDCFWDTGLSNHSSSNVHAALTNATGPSSSVRVYLHYYCIVRPLLVFFLVGDSRHALVLVLDHLSASLFRFCPPCFFSLRTSLVFENMSLQIDAFVQRCSELLEVCESQIQLARKTMGGGGGWASGPLPEFGGTRGQEVRNQHASMPAWTIRK